MKKSIYILCLLFLVTSLLIGCNKVKNSINVDKEKIGNEYTVIEDLKLPPNDSHGTVKNYESSYNDNVWTTTFDYMNSTGSQSLEINPKDTLKVNSKLKSGTVWVKITQGDLTESEIQKVEAKNDETVTIDLSQWKDGKIIIWLVVENGENGLIQIEHVQKTD